MGSCEDIPDLTEDSNRLLAELGQDSGQKQTNSAESGLHKRTLGSWRSLASKLRGTWFVKELVALVRLAVPVIFSLSFEYSLLVISLLFIGHIPDSNPSTIYAAAGLASSFVNVTGISVGNGLATASDTLSSQAFGYKNYKRVGVVLQRGILILGVFLLPICALWLNSESILLLLRQDPCVASLSGLYAKLCCAALPFAFLYILLQHYMQSQGIVWQFVFIGFFANCVCVVLNVIFIYWVKLGLSGAVLSLVLSYTLLPITVVVYIWVRGLHKQTWGGWSWDSLNQWGQYLKLAIPGLLMTCFEWWSAEITTFVSGSISDVELASNSVWFQTMGILYMVPLGVSVATSVRVGNELGAGNPAGAKRASYVAVGLILCVAVLYTILLLSVKNVIGYLFVPGNDEVAYKVSNLMYVACFFLYFDQVQVVIGGALRGSGRQYIGAIMNVIAYYIIGLPVGITLALKANMGALGLWIGMSGGNIVHSVTFVVVLLRTNWQKQSEKAMKAAQRVPSENNSDTSASSDTEKETEGDNDSLISSENGSTSSKELLFDGGGENVALEDLAQVKLEEDEVSVGSSDEHQDENDVTSPPSHVCNRKTNNSRRRLKDLLLKSSFFLVGLAVLVTGGVTSRFLHPYVDPEEYWNCSSTDSDSNGTFQLQWSNSNSSLAHQTTGGPL